MKKLILLVILLACTGLWYDNHRTHPQQTVPTQTGNTPMATYNNGAISISGQPMNEYKNGPITIDATPVPAKPKAAPAPAPAPTQQQTYYAPVDPYAGTPFGNTAGHDQAVADYGTQKGQAYGSITQRIGDEGNTYGSSILDLIGATQAGQSAIDSKSVQNELSKRQGTAGVLDKIGHGLQSGGVMLANKNASNSSAVDALGRAYSDIGRRDQTGVNNQYEQGNSAIQDSQNAFNLQTATNRRHLDEGKVKTINSIVTDASNALLQLNQSAQNASLPDRVNIDAEKERIRNDALAKLQAYDEQLNSGLGGIKPSDTLTNRGKAAALDTAGTAADNSFSYSSALPAQFQNTGPFASALPTFNFPGTKKDQLGV